MTSTFNSGLDLVAWCLKGEGLSYAVSSAGNNEYTLTKISNGTSIAGDNDNRDIINIKLSSRDVNFPLTISNSVCKILCDKWILPLIRGWINGTVSDGDHGYGFELNNALKASKDDFYKNGLSGVGLTSMANSMNNHNYQNNILQDSGDRSTNTDFKPGFEDEFQLQQGNRKDLDMGLGRGFGGINGRLGGIRGYGDSDLYPNGERYGNWSDPLGGSFHIGGGNGSIGAVPGMPGTGGMYPTFDDPLFQQQQQGGNGRRRDGNGGGFNGLNPNIRYDDPTGGSGGFI